MDIDFHSEKQIEDYVYTEMSDHQWNPIEDCRFDGAVWRQVAIPGYGILDLMTLHEGQDKWLVTIYELKNENLCERHLAQAARYLAGAKRTTDRYPLKIYGGKPVVYRGVLAGPLDAQKGDFVYLLPLIPVISVYDLTMSMSCGFVSNRVGAGWHSRGETRKMNRKLFQECEEAFQPQYIDEEMLDA